MGRGERSLRFADRAVGSHGRLGAAWDGMNLGFSLVVLVMAVRGQRCQGAGLEEVGGPGWDPPEVSYHSSSGSVAALGVLHLPHPPNPTSPSLPAPLPLPLPVMKNGIIFL